MTKEEKIEITKFLSSEFEDGELFEYHLERYFEEKDIDVDNIINYTQTYDDMCNDMSNIVTKSLGLYLKILQLPTRTVETIEVGDYVDMKEDFGNGNRQVIIENEHHLRWLKSCFNDNAKELLNAIPHEAIELLKEVIE